MTGPSNSIGTVKRQLSIELFRGRARSFFWLRVGALVLTGMDGRACVATLRIAQALDRAGHAILARWMVRRIERRFQCYIGPRAEIGDGLRLAHPVGIVIGNGVVIGERCAIYQNVSLGSAHGESDGEGRLPAVGDDVLLSTGSVLIGGIMIGNNVSVGANAVVVRDVPDGHTAVGVPARLVSPKVAA